MVAGVAGTSRSVLETQEGLVFGRDHCLEVGEHLVAELRAVDVSAKPGEFVAACAPAGGEVAARHEGNA